jgi:hypothetical protein
MNTISILIIGRTMASIKYDSKKQSVLNIIIIITTINGIKTCLIRVRFLKASVKIHTNIIANS